MYCNISEIVTASQWVGSSAFMETVLSCFQNLCLLLQNQRNHCDVVSVLLGYARVYYKLCFQFEKSSLSFGFFCVVKFSKAWTKGDTKPRGLGSQRKMGSCLKLDDADTGTGKGFPIHVVVSMSSKSWSSTQIDWKFKNFMLLKSFWLPL